MLCILIIFTFPSLVRQRDNRRVFVNAITSHSYNHLLTLPLNRFVNNLLVKPRIFVSSDCRLGGRITGLRSQRQVRQTSPDGRRRPQVRLSVLSVPQQAQGPHLSTHPGQASQQNRLLY